MNLIEYVAPRVKRAYREEEIHCTPTTLRILGELFSVPIEQQVYHAASGMHGAGLYGAQCGLVEGSVMFIGIFGRKRGLTVDEVEPLCFQFAERFEKKFGSLLCRELRPEGFSDDNPPHLCEPRTIEAIAFAAEYLAEKFRLNI